ncbi:Prolyl oligopeptidase family protein [Urbifossiella limnaea]|uniref:Prolyl oligopeptidase family protein n=1 Tax=Urbifossiella limnaea TaxID=2528023 RepID=A0A517XWS6_9BACT|nr:Prolyl oligopeptidase family protein [Urbifossiella limnaea]
MACFFPPTDFPALEGTCPKEIAAPFDFRELDPATGKYVTVSPERRREIGREASPITHAAMGAAPTLIIHGDKDKVVPLSQSETLIAKLMDCGATCELKVKPGKGHFGPWVAPDLPSLADWFDVHLLSKK